MYSEEIDIPHNSDLLNAIDKNYQTLLRIVWEVKSVEHKHMSYSTSMDKMDN